MRVDMIFFFVLLLLFVFAPASQAAAIHDAAKKGDIAALTAALDSGVDENASNGLATPLYYAIDGGHLEAAKLLLSRGANVETPSIWGPALVPAASGGKVELVRLLLESGANPNAKTGSKSVLHIAAQKGWLDCVKALVQAGANVNAQTTETETPIHLAKLNKHRDVAEYLMANGVILPRPAPISAKLASADAEKGRILFIGSCARCHFIEPQKSRKVGPPLWGVVGRDKASVSEEGYSDALRVWEGGWSYEDLNLFLFGPMVTTPGVFMEIPGIQDETERINLIAYLRTLSDKPIPLP